MLEGRLRWYACILENYLDSCSVGKIYYGSITFDETIIGVSHGKEKGFWHGFHQPEEGVPYDARYWRQI